MKIYLTEKQVIELAYSALDMNCPDPDKVHDIALRMDMVYSEDIEMYEDVQEVSLRKYTRRIDELQKALDYSFQMALKYQEAIAPQPLTDEEHSFFGRVTQLLTPSHVNCNHKWFIDTKPTVAIKRCWHCGLTEGVTSDELWSASPKNI